MPPAPDAIAGHVLAGKYRLLRVLGRGGGGEVYEAENVQTHAPLAVKKLLPGLADAERLAARFRREANAVSLLDHPNIVEVIDFVSEQDALCIVMELVRGRSVGTALESGALEPRRSLVIARQVLEALAHAHARGMIHRDIKPDNIMLVPHGEPGREYESIKLLDFGLVKLIGDAAGSLGDQRLTQTGVVFGTPAYMAPEHVLGRDIDGRADLYALGVVLFEMLIGRAPYQSPDPTTLMRMQATAPVPSLAAAAPWCTPELEHLIARALAKRPEERHATAHEMISALDAAFLSLDHLPAGG